MAFVALIVSYASLGYLLMAQHYRLCSNGFITPPSALHLPHLLFHPPPARPLPIVAICDITGIEKTTSQEHSKSAIIL